MKDSINIAVAGATGYVGLELIKILSKHPKVKIVYLCAQKSIGKNISFFDKGIGAYGGLGAGIDVYDNISIELAYDIIGLSKNASFEDASSLISVGIKIRN